MTGGSQSRQSFVRQRVAESRSPGPVLRPHGPPRGARPQSWTAGGGRVQMLESPSPDREQTSSRRASVHVFLSATPSPHTRSPAPAPRSDTTRISPAPRTERAEFCSLAPVHFGWLPVRRRVTLMDPADPSPPPRQMFRSPITPVLLSTSASSHTPTANGVRAKPSRHWRTTENTPSVQLKGGPCEGGREKDSASTISSITISARRVPDLSPASRSPASSRALVLVREATPTEGRRVTAVKLTERVTRRPAEHRHSFTEAGPTPPHHHHHHHNTDARRHSAPGGEEPTRLMMEGCERGERQETQSENRPLTLLRTPGESSRLTVDTIRALNAAAVITNIKKQLRQRRHTPAGSGRVDGEV